jgi:hypothetical protein
MPPISLREVLRTLSYLRAWDVYFEEHKQDERSGGDSKSTNYLQLLGDWLTRTGIAMPQSKAVSSSRFYSADGTESSQGNRQFCGRGPLIEEDLSCEMTHQQLPLQEDIIVLQRSPWTSMEVLKSYLADEETEHDLDRQKTGSSPVPVSLSVTQI